MIKNLFNKTCAFDAEWVPCTETARTLLKLPDTLGERQVMEAIWQHYAKEEGERPFLKLALSKVVSIAAIFRNYQEGGIVNLTLYARGIDQYSEGDMIQHFLEYVAQNEYQLWGFNSANADVPILKQRAIALGVPCPHFSKRPNKPWEGLDYHDARNSEAHVDILNAIGGFGGATNPSLNEFAAACGIPGKLDVAGDSVADLYLEGKIREIVEYNETDALTTHLVMLQIGLHSGRLTPQQYAIDIAAIDRLVTQKSESGKHQHHLFLTEWKKRRKARNHEESQSIDNATITLLQTNWKRFLEQVRERCGIKARGGLNSVRDIAVTDSTIYLAFGNNSFARDMINDMKSEIEPVLSEFIGCPVNIVCQLGNKAQPES